MRNAVLLLLLVACSSDDETARLEERMSELESRIDRLEQVKEEPAPAETKSTATKAAEEEEEDRATDAWDPLPLLDDSEPPPESETVVVTMDSVSLRFHGRPVTRDELRELLKRRVDAGTKVSLVLRASGDASTARVNEIVELARALGIAHIARAQTE